MALLPHGDMKLLTKIQYYSYCIYVHYELKPTREQKGDRGMTLIFGYLSKYVNDHMQSCKMISVFLCFNLDALGLCLVLHWLKCIVLYRLGLQK